MIKGKQYFVILNWEIDLLMSKGKQHFAIFVCSSFCFAFAGKTHFNFFSFLGGRGYGYLFMFRCYVYVWRCCGINAAMFCYAVMFLFRRNVDVSLKHSVPPIRAAAVVSRAAIEKNPKMSKNKMKIIKGSALPADPKNMNFEKNPKNGKK